MDNKWNWVVRYVVVIALSLILAGAFGSMDLFKTTALVGKKLNAAHLVKFLGFTAALTVLWMLAARGALVLRDEGERWALPAKLLVPLATLIAAACAHPVAMLLLEPLVDPSLRTVLNWLFIAGIVAAAGWVVMSVLELGPERRPGAAAGDKARLEPTIAGANKPR